jgi:hypothetical protein
MGETLAVLADKSSPITNHDVSSFHLSFGKGFGFTPSTPCSRYLPVRIYSADLSQGAGS